MTLWFVVPAHGRFELTKICLRQLRRTCDALTAEGLEATAIVIADDKNLATARSLGFGTYERDNRFLSRKFNDGIQAACDRDVNPRPADFVVPFGSDDWIDYRILLNLPPRNTVACFQHMSFVNEDASELQTSFIRYAGGCGIRVYPRQVVAQMAYRPADEDRRRGCDLSILSTLRREVRLLRVVHHSIDPRQIVDWKTAGANLNSYAEIGKHRRAHGPDPFAQLEGFYPPKALREMRQLSERRLVAV